MNENCVYWSNAPLANAKCTRGFESCEKCASSLSINDKQFAAKWEDPLVILDRQRVQTTSLRGMLAGGSAFLIGGGPSANELPLALMARRGVWSLAVNNSAGHPKIRPQAFVCSDPPKKFSHSIWLDPAIMKFIPTPKLNGRRSRLRKKIDGSFVDMKEGVADCPNVWAFNRVSWLKPSADFFASDGACWGNHESGCQKTGEKKTVCTMLLALRLLYYLGARTIYLVGVDFRMADGYGYSFNQHRAADAVSSNNGQFTVVNEWLVKMQNDGVFDKFGVKIYNCFERSGLRAFPYVPFELAIDRACGIIERTPDLANWYDK